MQKKIDYGDTVKVLTEYDGNLDFLHMPKSGLHSGLVLDMSEDKFPLKVYAFGIPDKADMRPTIGASLEGDAHFGYIVQGPTRLDIRGYDAFNLQGGMFFSTSNPFKLSGGYGILIQQLQRQVDFQIGGPIQGDSKQGYAKLHFADGWKYTPLVHPAFFGHATMNHVNLVQDFRERMVSKAWPRIGVVARGEGFGITGQEVFRIQRGDMFMIPRNSEFAFRACADMGMDVIVFEAMCGRGGEHEVNEFDVAKALYVKRHDPLYWPLFQEEVQGLPPETAAQLDVSDFMGTAQEDINQASKREEAEHLYGGRYA